MTEARFEGRTRAKKAAANEVAPENEPDLFGEKGRR